MHGTAPVITTTPPAGDVPGARDVRDGPFICLILPVLVAALLATWDGRQATSIGLASAAVILTLTGLFQLLRTQLGRLDETTPECSPLPPPCAAAGASWRRSLGSWKRRCVSVGRVLGWRSARPGQRVPPVGACGGRSS